MTFRTLTAKYPGVCKRCKAAIVPGQKIRYAGPGQTWHMAADCPTGEARTVAHHNGDGSPEYLEPLVNERGPGSQYWAETRGDDLGESPDF